MQLKSWTDFGKFEQTLDRNDLRMMPFNSEFQAIRFVLKVIDNHERLMADIVRTREEWQSTNK